MSGSESKQQSAKASGSAMTYADAGVSIEAGDTFARSIQSMMRRTHGPRVLANMGGFAGLFRLDYNEKLFKRNYRDPVLVACCDGVGTKVKLAAEFAAMHPESSDAIWADIGQDLVAMNVNDLVVQGAEPLLFLDYIACHRVEQRQMAAIVSGIARACAACDCALLGGETAEMNDVYPAGEIDLAGFSLGVVELKRATDPERVEAGDIVLGLGSTGVHSNGYSLVRRVHKDSGVALDSTDWNRSGVEGSAGELGTALLRPTRLYAAPVVKLLRQYKVKKIVSGMAHITGGGIEGNLNRALHEGVRAVVDADAWTVPPIFEWIQNAGGVDLAEMRRVFNMGIGYTLIVRPSFADSVRDKLTKLGENVFTIGVIEQAAPERGGEVVYA